MDFRTQLLLEKEERDMETNFSFSEQLNAMKTLKGEEETARLTFTIMEKAMVIPQGSTEKLMELLAEVQEDSKLGEFDWLKRHSSKSNVTLFTNH